MDKRATRSHLLILHEATICRFLICPVVYDKKYLQNYTTDIPISLSCALCFISKCYRVNMLH